MTQDQALAILKTGANVFLSGEPGSGKTYSVNQYVAYLRSCGIEPAITASTGIAATHIGGMTIHSWSGIGVRQALSEQDLDRLAQNEYVARRVGRAKVLIIDEVSMLSAATFSMVEQVCRELRRSPQAFGGLQVILVGDFFQLPPVVRRNEEAEHGARLGFENAADNPRAQFAYHAPAWQAAKPVVCYLSEQHRQEDAVFLDILSALRSGILNGEHKAQIERRRIAENAQPAGVTKLFPHNADVDRINQDELSKLSGESHVFEMRERGAKQLVEQLKKSCLSPERLKLKIGAKVMFTKNNIEQGFVNGTTGTVVGFRKSDGLAIVKTRGGKTIAAEPLEWVVEAEGKALARIIQIPLRLAWAITVHKSQGMSLDAAVVDLSQAFEYGQGYVALSRVRTLKGLHILGWNERALEVHPGIRTQDAEFRAHSEAARIALLNTERKELERMHADFIRACGGAAPSADSSTAKEMLASGARKTRQRVAGWERTLALIVEGKSVTEAARLRGRTEGTIIEHLESLRKLGKLPVAEIAHIARGRERAVEDICARLFALGPDRLKPVYEHFEGAHSYNTIRLARLLFDK